MIVKIMTRFSLSLFVLDALAASRLMRLLHNPDHHTMDYQIIGPDRELGSNLPGSQYSLCFSPILYHLHIIRTVLNGHHSCQPFYLTGIYLIGPPGLFAEYILADESEYFDI